MEDKIGIYFKILAIFFTLFFLARPLFYLFEAIKDMFTGDNQRRHNLDELISQKKNLLSDSFKTTGTPKGHFKNISMTLEERYSRIYAKKNDPQIKKMLDIIRSLQWGGGGVVDEIEESLMKQHRHRPKSSQVIESIRNVLYGRYAEMATNKDNPPTFPQIQQAVHCLILANDNKLEWDIETCYVQKGLESLLDKKRRPILLLMADKKEFLNSWRTHAQFFQVIEPVANLDKDDKNKAEKILGLAGNYDLAQLKAAYKKAAKKKHPDLLAGIKVELKDKKKAEENFANLKKAYDLLLKKLS